MDETKQEPPTPEEAQDIPSPESQESDAESGFPQGVFKQEEIDLNEMFPGEEQDLNELFPEKELKTLLSKVHKSQKDLAKINTRFVDDTEHIVPKAASDEVDG